VPLSCITKGNKQKGGRGFATPNWVDRIVVGPYWKRKREIVFLLLPTGRGKEKGRKENRAKPTSCYARLGEDLEKKKGRRTHVGFVYSDSPIGDKKKKGKFTGVTFSRMK